MHAARVAPDLLVITGLTASGKTDLAIDLARHLADTHPLEIVCCDSMLVYKGLSIGTAKPDAAILQEIPHHCLNLVEPHETFSVGDFVRHAQDAIAAIHQRGHLPVLVGGTGLYVRALTQGLLKLPPLDPELEAHTKAQYAAIVKKEGSCKSLYQRLERDDFLASRTIHPNDFYRIARALLIFDLTGKPLSQYQQEHGFAEKPYRTLKLAIDWPRAELYARINQRILNMIDQGLLAEVADLLRRGISPDSPCLKGLAYHHFIDVVSGRKSLPQAIALTQRDSRHFAKRQATWFRPMADLIHLTAGPDLLAQGLAHIRPWMTFSQVKSSS